MGRVDDIVKAIMETEKIELPPEEVKERTEFLRAFIGVLDLNDPKDFLPSKEKIQELINETVEKNKATQSDEDIAKQKKMMEQVFIEGKTPADALGLKPDAIEFIYNEAGRCYNSGQYKDALALFTLADSMVPGVPKQLFGLAACYQMMNRHDDAIRAYLKCAYYDRESPLPYFHMSDCFMKMKNYEGVLGALTCVLERAGTDPRYNKIVGKTKLMIEDAKKKLKENPV